MDPSVNTCQICESEPAKYVCPRCGLPYCSVQCYRNEAKHLNCSETFYKKCVMENVKDHIRDNPEQADKMKEILSRFNQEFNSNDLTDLENADQEEEPDELDSDDDEPLEVRMQGINLDDTDEVWKHLTEEEKADFKKLAAGANAIDVIPEWVPWWTVEPKKKLVEELSAESGSGTTKIQQNWQPLQPRVIPNIPLMSSLTKIRPNNHVKIGLSNVISSYVWTSRIYAGEIATNDRPEDVAGAIITLSAFLATDSIFDTFENAVANVPMKACQDPLLFDGGPLLHKKLKEDVVQILSSHNIKVPNSNKLYVLSALSDCFSVLCAAQGKQKAKPQNSAASGSKDEKNSSQETFEAMFPTPPPAFVIDAKLLAKAKRKLHYLLAFANEYDVL